MASRGIFLPLQVFYTASKGWGVRCEVDLPIGTFVCCYIGRVCTNSEANELRGKDEYIFDLNHFESVAQHLADNPADASKVMILPGGLALSDVCCGLGFCHGNKSCVQEELSLLPRLPPEDFFSWASEIPCIDGSPASLPSVREVVCNRGWLKHGVSVGATHDDAREDGIVSNGQQANTSPLSEVVRAVGSGSKPKAAADPSTSITGNCRVNGRTDWHINMRGQVSADADKVLHECRQAHGGQAIWTAYEYANSVTIPGSAGLIGILA